MAVKGKGAYTQYTIGELAAKLEDMPGVSRQAAALAINKGATFARRESIREIANKTTMKPSYIGSKITTTRRAKPTNLHATVTASNRATLTGRYEHYKVGDRVKLKLNRAGGFRTIPKAWVAKNLKNSGKTGVAQQYKFAVEYFERNIGQGEGRTPGKVAKLAKMKTQAKKTPNRMYVWHNRSINQLFGSEYRRFVDPMNDYIAEQFIADFSRLSNK